MSDAISPRSEEEWCRWGAARGYPEIPVAFMPEMTTTIDPICGNILREGRCRSASGQQIEFGYVLCENDRHKQTEKQPEWDAALRACLWYMGCAADAGIRYCDCDAIESPSPLLV